MMKKNILLLALLTMVLVWSCKSKPKSREEMVREFRSELTTEDTVTMLRMCDQAMELLKAKDYDQFLSNLYEYDDSTKVVSKLSEETAKRYRSNFQMFPVLEYEREYFSFMLEGCNDVKYNVVFMTAEQTGYGEPAKTSFMFNPVKIDGDWKLCVKTAKDKLDAEYY